MTARMKYYYLLQTAYWAQQLFVLVLKIEKPRKDYTELVIHHAVTIWLIGYVPNPPFGVIMLIGIKLELPYQPYLDRKCRVCYYGLERRLSCGMCYQLSAI
jgi:hypothetical protein